MRKKKDVTIFDGEKIGTEAGRKVGKMARIAIETARLTARETSLDVDNFRDAFLYSFKKEIKKLK